MALVSAAAYLFCMKMTPKPSTPVRKAKPSSATTVYLLLYNGLQTLGWTAILAVLIHHYTNNENCAGLWLKEEYLVKIFQTLAVFEIIHAAIRIVPSNPFLTFIQIFSRVFVVWGVIHSFARVHNSITLPVVLIAWSITEVIRYLYYVMYLVGWVPYALLWCRYTFFIVLYPMGVSGEILTTIFALPYIRDTQWYSITMPNFANVSFSYYYFVIFVLLAYIPGFPQMYLHMLKQRKKVLSPDPKKTN